ncbi:unnamed protein product [Rodentolepis nana]|uniref:Uncharacterized protein n=1 Tax=Rodentolepis nana TaxID=102285 RepID=A0A0R3U005_RODNA|nr:unnamed protein product [Rodentolepis nana]
MLFEQAVRRFRRELPTSPGAQIIDPLEWDYNGNYSNSIDAAAGRFNGKYNYQKVSFRRIPKEVNWALFHNNESASSPSRPVISSALVNHSITKSTAISPSIARRRPRASGIVSPLSSEGLPILVKPPNPTRQSNLPNSNQLEAVVKTPQTIASIDEPHKLTFNRRVSCHRRGLSEASALLLKASNVRQTNSLGDLQPTPNPFESKSPGVKNDIDVDLFGAAFDAIRNQSRAPDKPIVSRSLEQPSGSFFRRHIQRQFQDPFDGDWPSGEIGRMLPVQHLLRLLGPSPTPIFLTFHRHLWHFIMRWRINTPFYSKYIAFPPTLSSNDAD